MPVQVSVTIEIPARSVMLIQATVQGGLNVNSVQEGLLEPNRSMRSDRTRRSSHKW